MIVEHAYFGQICFDNIIERSYFICLGDFELALDLLNHFLKILDDLLVVVMGFLETDVGIK